MVPTLIYEHNAANSFMYNITQSIKFSYTEICEICRDHHQLPKCDLVNCLIFYVNPNFWPAIHHSLLYLQTVIYEMIFFCFPYHSNLIIFLSIELVENYYFIRFMVF